MKQLFIWLLCLPVAAAGQHKAYYSADAGVQFAKSIAYTGYGINGSANIRAVEKIFIGVATGAVQVKPFVSNPAFFINGRLTFFTSGHDERLAPFALFEAGKLFYSERNFAGQPSQRMEGGLNFFTGVGVRLGAQKLHPFFAIGYAGYYYNNNSYRNEVIETTRPYRFRRVVLRLGFMLPK